MRLPGSPSYPAHRQGLIRALGLLDIIIILEGVGTLAWLMVHPSEPGSRFFLAYSLERWILILAIAAIILAFLFFLWAIRFRSNRVERLISYFERPKYARRLLVSISFLFILTTGALMWLHRMDAIRSYSARLLPLQLWGTVVLAQMWLFLIVLMWPTLVQTIKEYFPVSEEAQVYPIHKNIRFVLIGITLIYLVFQIESYFNVREAILIGDSWSYLQGASLDINDPAFFSERRPWAILLFYKLLRSSQTAIDIFQLSISTMAWLFLAWKFIGSIKNNWIKVSGFIVILGFSLAPAVQVWNHAVLSESLSISLMVVIFALFIGLVQKWEWRPLLFLMVFFVLWMSIREANAYVALMVAFALVVIGFLQRGLRVYWLLSVLIGVAFLINYQLSSRYALPRWALPLAEVITKRILPDQEYRDFFANNGMPVTPELMALSGRWANSDEYAIVNSVELRKFEKWLYMNGRNVYVKFLLTHPSYAIMSPIKDSKVLLAEDYFKSIPIPRYKPTLPQIVNEVLYPERWFWVYFWLSLFVSGYIFVASLRSKRKAYRVVFIFLLLSVPHLYFVWYGDALDIARHAVIGNLQFHLGIWSLVILYFDGIFTS